LRKVFKGVQFTPLLNVAKTYFTMMKQEEEKNMLFII